MDNVDKKASFLNDGKPDFDLIHDVDEGSTCSQILRVLIIILSSIISIIPLTWFFAIKIFDQYERAVIFRLGKLKREQAYGPGIIYVFPFVDTFKRIDLRIKTVNVNAQSVMTLDSVTITVDAIIFFHVNDPTKAVLTVQNFTQATSLIAATTLRSVIGSSELDELLQKRDMISNKLKNILVGTAMDWGISIDSVEIRDVELPQNMQRVMASQAEAERDRRAKVISANGELQAADGLHLAAEDMSKNPATLQLRYLQTLTQIAVEHPTKIIFPLPMKMKSLAESQSKG